MVDSEMRSGSPYVSYIKFCSVIQNVQICRYFYELLYNVTIYFHFVSSRSLAILHDNSFVHADLKPANVMWSSYDGCFKLLDFGLTFHTEEGYLHQIQSSGNNFYPFSAISRVTRHKRLYMTLIDPAYCNTIL